MFIINLSNKFNQKGSLHCAPCDEALQIQTRLTYVMEFAFSKNNQFLSQSWELQVYSHKVIMCFLLVSEQCSHGRGDWKHLSNMRKQGERAQCEIGHIL